MITFTKLRYKNFLSTGDYFTEITLNEYPTTLVLGENGSGKSTMLDALTFVLFSKPFRKINKPQLVNTINESGLLVEVEFFIGRKKYLIRRGIKPGIFEIYVDGILLNQDAKAKDYQEKLEKQILKLNYKSFTQIIILGSSSFQPFMQLPTSARRDVIEDLLDIQIFSIMNQILKDKIVLNSNFQREVLHKIELAEEKEKLIEGYKLEAEEINRDKISKTKVLMTENNEIVSGHQKAINHLQMKNENHNQSLVTYDEKGEYQTQLLDLKRKIDNNIKITKKEITTFVDMRECPTCEQVLDDKYRDVLVDERNEKVGSYEDGLINLQKELDLTISNIGEMDSVRQQIDENNNEVQSLNYKIQGVNEYIIKLQGEIEHLIKVKEKSSGDDERLIKLKQELSGLETEKKDFSNDLKYLKIAGKLLKDSGIKTKIIRQYLPIMNKLINNHLSAMDSYFNFELDENFNEIIKSRYRDVFSYSSFSEGEKMRIDLALLFTWRAIAKMKNSANTNLLILDEVFDSSLDSTGTEEFLKLLHTLGSNTNVYIISHKGDALYEKFEHVIKFEKIKNFSKVV
jgi:DNA repair exonuclease SbcCD ATPase subunit